MKQHRAIAIAEQCLFALVMIVAFLLIFDDRLVVPYWLQPVGRMHPLLLHFPISFLTLSVCIAIYRSMRHGGSDPIFEKAERGLLLAGTLLTGITLIMGLFLSREGGYSADTLAWHKWSGATVFFLAALVYLMAFRASFHAAVAWGSGLLVMASLVMTGHYGADLSHGEGFLTEPITSHREIRIVPLEKAVVYADVIQPILDRKCISCHNKNKLKGELMLTDSAGLIKGGKSGRLFVPGNPDTSLMIERIHLAMQDEKHMPPEGKPQLTKEEMALLSAWIKQDAGYHIMVTALESGDSLRMLATNWLQRNADAGTQYDFDAADPKTIQKLNTDYRTISPIAKNAPALEVNIYNRGGYQVSQVKELEPIRKQVTSLNLNKMPVKNEDLQAVNGFENLRRLDLDFTDVTDDGLETLKGLAHLHTINLAGTAVTARGITALIKAMPELKSVTLWKTGVNTAEGEQLKQEHKSIAFNMGFVDDGKNPLKLNPPQIANATTVFASELPLMLRHPIKGVQIRFTMDGTEPDSIHGLLFDGKTTVNRTTAIKAKAYKEGWYSSDVVMFDLLRNTFIPDSVRLMAPLTNVHQAEGANTFFNKRLGVIGANNPAWANNWAGVQDNDMVLMAMFRQPVQLSGMGIHYMVEEKTGIYPPATVEVWGGEDERSARLLLTMHPQMPVKGSEPYLKLTEGSFTTKKVSYLKIIAKPHRAGKDKHLLLVDEMLLN